VKADFSLDEISGAIEELLEGHALSSHEATAPTVEKTSKGYMIYL